MGYTISFKTLKDRLCTVAIAGGGTAVDGAANPVEWEEDDSDNMLDFVRTKTGYVRVLEYTYGALSGLFPTSATSHPITVTYDGHLAFKGYLQPQTFENDWTNGTRTMEFPIVSLLGVADRMKFTVKTAGGRTSLGELLQEVCAGLGIDNVIFPTQIELASYYDVYNPLVCTIRNTIISPYNDNFQHGQTNQMGEQEPLQKSITYMEFLDMLCAAFGLTCHEDVISGLDKTCLVFTRTNYSGEYGNYSVGSWATSIVSGGSSTFAAFDHVGADGKESLIMPLKTIELKADEEFITKYGLDDIFDHGILGSNLYSLKSQIILMSNTDEIYGTTGSPSIDSSNPNGDVVTLPSGTTAGAWLCAFGSFGATDEGVLMRYDMTNEDPQTVKHFPIHMVFSEWPDSFNAFSIKVKLKVGQYLNKMATPSTFLDELGLSNNGYSVLTLRIRCGSYYWSGSQWAQASQVVPTVDMQIDNDSGEGVLSFVQKPPVDDPIDIAYCWDFFKNQWIIITPFYIRQLHIGILEAKIEASSDSAFTKYQVRQQDSIIISGGGIDDGSVTQKIQNWRKDRGFIEYGQIPTAVGLYFTPLKTPQRRLDFSLQRLTAALDALSYLDSWTVNSETFRMVGSSFYPEYDEYRVKLHRNI